MKKLYLPILFNEDCQEKAWGFAMAFERVMGAYYDKDAAVEKAKELALSNPKCKVLILTSDQVVEPRSVEFSVKSYSAKGELLV